MKTLNSPIIEVASKKDDTVNEITLLIHKIGQANMNGLDYLKEQTEANMATLINKPIVAKYFPEIEDFGTHEQTIDPKTGKIVGLENTTPIGTITDVWIDKVDEAEDVEALYAKATIWSYKFPEATNVIKKHFEDETSNTSVEIQITEYGEGKTAEYRYGEEFTYLGHCILGSNIAGADSDAKVLSFAEKEVAQAIVNDLSKIEEEGEQDTLEIKFNKDVEIANHVEVSSVSFDTIRNSIYEGLNPSDPSNGTREYNYYIQKIYTDYAIVEDWDETGRLYKIPYSIVNNKVVLSEQEDWKEGSLGFIPNGIEVAQLVTEAKELTVEIASLKEEAKNMADKAVTVEGLQADLDAKIIELNSKITELETVKESVTELNATIVSEATAKQELEEKITELSAKVEELKPFKEKVETAEKEAKALELNSKYSKLLDEETMASEGVKKAIEEGNEIELNQLVVDFVMSGKKVTPKEEETVIETNASQDTELVDLDSRTEFGLSY